MNLPDSQLVDAETLRQILFDARSRPTLRTIRNWQKARRIPYIPIGRKIYFDPPAVREALQRQNTVRAK